MLRCWSPRVWRFCSPSPSRYSLVVRPREVWLAVQPAQAFFMSAGCLGLFLGYVCVGTVVWPVGRCPGSLRAGLFWADVRCVRVFWRCVYTTSCVVWRPHIFLWRAIFFRGANSGWNPGCFGGVLQTIIWYWLLCFGSGALFCPPSHLFCAGALKIFELVQRSEQVYKRSWFVPRGFRVAFCAWAPPSVNTLCAKKNVCCPSAGFFSVTRDLRLFWFVGVVVMKPPRFCLPLGANTWVSFVCVKFASVAPRFFFSARTHNFFWGVEKFVVVPTGGCYFCGSRTSCCAPCCAAPRCQLKIPPVCIFGRHTPKGLCSSVLPKMRQRETVFVLLRSPLFCPGSTVCLSR